MPAGQADGDGNAPVENDAVAVPLKGARVALADFDGVAAAVPVGVTSGTEQASMDVAAEVPPRVDQPTGQVRHCTAPSVSA